MIMSVIKNKKFFYTGLTLQIIQFSIIGILLLTLVHWEWFTFKKIGLIFLVLYNIISALLILNGFINDSKCKKEVKK